MEKIHILTDSSSDIPHDLVEAHGIETVSYTHLDVYKRQLFNQSSRRRFDL